MSLLSLFCLFCWLWWCYFRWCCLWFRLTVDIAWLIDNPLTVLDELDDLFFDFVIRLSILLIVGVELIRSLPLLCGLFHHIIDPLLIQLTLIEGFDRRRHANIVTKTTSFVLFLDAALVIIDKVVPCIIVI